MVCSFIICIPLSFYYAFAAACLADVGVEGVTLKMTYGQISEIFFMVLMPLFFARLGVKKMLLVGMLAWAARYALFAFGAADPASPVPSLLLAGVMGTWFYLHDHHLASWLGKKTAQLLKPIFGELVYDLHYVVNLPRHLLVEFFLAICLIMIVLRNDRTRRQSVDQILVVSQLQRKSFGKSDNSTYGDVVRQEAR